MKVFCRLELRRDARLQGYESNECVYWGCNGGLFVGGVVVCVENDTFEVDAKKCLCGCCSARTHALLGGADLILRWLRISMWHFGRSS
jgi:hypothetical protein